MGCRLFLDLAEHGDGVRVEDGLAVAVVLVAALPGPLARQQRVRVRLGAQHRDRRVGLRARVAGRERQVPVAALHAPGEVPRLERVRVEVPGRQEALRKHLLHRKAPHGALRRENHQQC